MLSNETFIANSLLIQLGRNHTHIYKTGYVRSEILLRGKSVRSWCDGLSDRLFMVDPLSHIYILLLLLFCCCCFGGLFWGGGEVM